MIHKYYIFEKLEELPPHIIDYADTEKEGKEKLENYNKNNKFVMNTFILMKIIE